MQTESLENAMDDYRGLTHPVRWDWALWLWRRFMCPRNMHCFDEVVSSAGKDGCFRYLSCDACGLEVFVAGVSDRYVEKPGDTRGRAA